MEPRGSRTQGGVARPRDDEIGRRPRHSAQCGRSCALGAVQGQHPRWCFTFAGRRIRWIGSAWDRAKQRAGIEDFRFHDLRHTWASWHVQSGTSLPELMELGDGSRAKWCRAMRISRRRSSAPSRAASSAALRASRTRHVSNVPPTPSLLKCYPCLRPRNNPLPMCPERTLIDWRARRDSNSRPPGS